jgi:uncharacterized protein (TIGR03083 family)
MLAPVTPISTVDLFQPLSDELLGVLRGLSLDDWRRPTVCAGWSVKDVAAHLLGGSLGRLKDERAQQPGQPAPALSFAELLALIDRGNAEWVQAAQRICPSLLIEFLALTDRRLAVYFQSLPPDGPAGAAVMWAGESQSANWFDIAREYTEKWLHQQHIREAVGQPLLTARRWLYPILDTFLRALPYTYREVNAAQGTALGVTVTGEAGGSWTLLRGADRWQLFSGASEHAAARIQIDADTAWRLFTKGMAVETALARMVVTGDVALGLQIVHMVSLMA